MSTVKNIAYVHGKDADLKKHKLNLYLSKRQKDLPVFFVIHGGGWTSGERVSITASVAETVAEGFFACAVNLLDLPVG